MRPRRDDGEWWLRRLPVVRRGELPARTPARYAIWLLQTCAALGVAALILTLWLRWVEWWIYVTLLLASVAVDARDYGGRPWRHTNDR